MHAAAPLELLAVLLVVPLLAVLVLEVLVLEVLVLEVLVLEVLVLAVVVVLPVPLFVLLPLDTDAVVPLLVVDPLVVTLLPPLADEELDPANVADDSSPPPPHAARAMTTPNSIAHTARNSISLVSMRRDSAGRDDVSG